MGYVAFQYAEALFSLALEKNQVDLIHDGLKAIDVIQDEDVYKFLNHPKVHKRDKKKVFEKGLENQLLKNFMFVLIDNNRIDLIVEVLDEYQKLVDNQNKIMNVTVFSQKLLSISDLNKLKNNLAMKHGRKVKIENVVDETIIGGLRIEYEGNVMDNTINNYLETLKHNLTN